MHREHYLCPVFKKDHNEQPAFLFSIEHVLKEQADYLKECAGAIMDDLISNFPVFIMHKGEITWGENITGETNEDMEWQINLSTAEELIRRNIIELEKAKLFVAGFKNPRAYACILAIDKNEGAHFIFYPYP